MGRKYIIGALPSSDGPPTGDIEGDEDAIYEIAGLLLDGVSRGVILRMTKDKWPEFRIRWMSEADLLIRHNLTWPDWHPLGKKEKK